MADGEKQMITYGTDLNDISVTGTYRVGNQMKADNNPRHYLIIPGIVVQQILDAERKKKESDADEGNETALNRYVKEVSGDDE